MFFQINLLSYLVFSIFIIPIKTFESVWLCQIPGGGRWIHTPFLISDWGTMWSVISLFVQYSVNNVSTPTIKVLLLFSFHYCTNIYRRCCRFSLPIFYLFSFSSFIRYISSCSVHLTSIPKPALPNILVHFHRSIRSDYHGNPALELDPEHNGNFRLFIKVHSIAVELLIPHCLPTQTMLQSFSWMHSRSLACVWA